MSVRDELRTFLADRFMKGGRAESITDSTLLMDDLLDSIGLLELTVHLEETYDLRISADEITPENFGTLGALAAWIDGRRAGT